MAKLYFPGGPADGEPATVEVSPGFLRVKAGAIDVELPVERLVGRAGGYEDAWVIWTCDDRPGTELWLEQDFVRRELATMREQFGEPFRSRLDAFLLRQRRRSGARWAVRATLLVAFLGLLAWFLTGGLVSLAMGAIPFPLESKLGGVAAEQFAAQHPACDDSAVQGAMQQILDRLTARLGSVDYAYRVRVLRADDVNAFALPGGEIFFYSGLLEEARTPDEVAAVMGHELQHVVLRHGLRGMLQSAGLRVLLMVVLGDASEGLQILGGYAGQMGQLKFGRDQEREADVRGVHLMAEAGFDPQGAVDFFGRLAEASGDEGTGFDRMTSMASTHPASSERQERLRELARTLAPARTEPLAGVPWKKVRTLCGSGKGVREGALIKPGDTSLTSGSGMGDRGSSCEVKEVEDAGPKAYSGTLRPRARRLTPRSREMAGPREGGT